MHHDHAVDLAPGLTKLGGMALAVEFKGGTPRLGKIQGLAGG